jgi:hypothetical protein
MFRLELWYQNLWLGFQLSGAPESPCLSQIFCWLSISGAPDTRLLKGFEIFTESTMLNRLQFIAQENHYQHLDSPQTDPAQYTSNHPGIERMSRRYRVDISYTKTPLAYCRLIWSILPSLSSRRNEVQLHLRSTLLASIMVSDSTPHTYSIQRLISICRHSVFTYDPTPGTPLNRVYPHCIIFESAAASTQGVNCQRPNF